MFQIIPAIDLLDGKVVRLTKGDYDQSTIYSDNPAEFAKKWAPFGRIHIVDLNGAKEGRTVNIEAIKAIRQATNCTLEIGGGLRSNKDLEKLFDIGVDKVILGSIALKNKELTETLVDKYEDKIIIGIDAKDGMVAVEGWLETSTVTAADLLKEMAGIGVQEIIYTDISRDGMLSGPNFEAYRELTKETNVSIIASGGISSIDNIKELKEIQGLGGTIVGKALYENKIQTEELLAIA